MTTPEPFPIFKSANEKEVCNYGTYLETDSEGYLISKASIKNIPQKWMNLISDIVDICNTNIKKDNLVSILVDGSVASGVQVDNVSDLDMLLICKSTEELEATKLTNLDSPWFTEKKQSLYQKHPFTKRIHLTVWELDEVLNTKNIGKRFSLKTQAVTIQGKDLIKDIEKFKPDAKLAKELLGDIPSRISRYLEDIKQAENEDKTKFACFFSAKDIVRKAFLLVMPKEKLFTTSLYLSYSSFAKYYPDKSQDMYTLLYLVMNPSADKENLIKFIRDFGIWFANQMRSVRD